jgi:hypothetical protein
MLERSFTLLVFAAGLLAGQASKSGQPPLDEAGFRKAVQDGLPAPDNLAMIYALNHEEITTPILVAAIKEKLGEKRDKDEPQRKLFIWEASAIITYNGTQRAIDAVADLCSIDQADCPKFVNRLLGGGRVQERPYATAYDVAEQHPELRELVLAWVKRGLAIPAEAGFFADDVLTREKAGRPFSDNDVIMSGLSAETRERVHKAVEKARKEEQEP